jgi:broad specificity phosphatase PhoE
MKIFLVRHATPDWEHNNLPYDIQPGPRLSPKGEREAEALADFLKSQGVVRLFYSPFERGVRTAQIVASANEIPSVEEEGLAEWPMATEPEIHVRQRMSSVFGRAARESAKSGPIGLVSHGGPIALLLLELGMNQDHLAPYRTMFDTTNPLPPAGVWKVEGCLGEARLDFQLVFTPPINQSRDESPHGL